MVNYYLCVLSTYTATSFFSILHIAVYHCLAFGRVNVLRIAKLEVFGERIDFSHENT